VQTESRVDYYEKDDEQQSNWKGFIDLSKVQKITNSPKTKCGFDLHTKERIYYLQASSEEERAQWVGALSLRFAASCCLLFVLSSLHTKQEIVTCIHLFHVCSSSRSGNTSKKATAPQTSSSMPGLGPRSLSMAAAIGPSRSMQGDRQTGGSPPQPMAIPESGALDGGRERGNRRRESVPFVRNPTGGERTRELSMGGTPSSFRDDQVRLLQEKLQSLEAKLDVPSSSSSSSIPTRPTAQPPLGASSPTLPANSPETAASGTDAFLSQSLASQVSAALTGLQFAPSVEHADSPCQMQEAKEAEQQKLRALENQLEAAQEEVKRVTARLDYLKEKHQSTKHQLKVSLLSPKNTVQSLLSALSLLLWSLASRLLNSAWKA